MQKFLVGNNCPNFRKILELKGMNILKNTNGLCKKIILKSRHKMDLYPAIFSQILTTLSMKLQMLNTCNTMRISVVFLFSTIVIMGSYYWQCPTDKSQKAY